MTAFIERPIPSILGQPGYEVDSLHPQMYPPGYMPSPLHRQQQQQFLLSSPQPFSVIPSAAQYGSQHMGGHYMMPPGNVFSLPHSQAGDLHGAFSEMDVGGFPHRRLRRPTVSGIPLSAGGHYPYGGPQMAQHMGSQIGQHMMPQTDYQYCSGMVEACVFCQANHPFPHPLIQNPQHLPPMLSMSRHVGMTDHIPGQNHYDRHQQRRMDGSSPMFDPMDGSSGPWNANYQRRGGDFDLSSGGGKQRSRSIGPRRIMPGLIDDLRIAEISDSDDDDEMMTRGRAGSNNRRPGLSRRGSTVRMRSTSRASRGQHSNAPFI